MVILHIMDVLDRNKGLYPESFVSLSLFLSEIKGDEKVMDSQKDRHSSILIYILRHPSLVVKHTNFLQRRLYYARFIPFQQGNIGTSSAQLEISPG